MAAYWPWPRSVLSFYGPRWRPISPQLTVCIDPMRMYWACVHSSCILSARTRGTRKLKALNQPKKMKWRGGGRERSFLGGLSGVSNPMLVRRKDYTDWMSFQVYILKQQPGLTLFYNLLSWKRYDHTAKCASSKTMRTQQRENWDRGGVCGFTCSRCNYLETELKLNKSLANYF